MATEWINVIDTTIKIGLGAIISGTSTYFISSMNHKNNIEKAVLEKKINMVLDISEHVEKYFYFGTVLSNNFGHTNHNSHAERRPLTQKEKERLAEIHKDFRSVLESRNKALSIIKILLLDDAEDALLKYNDALSDFRDIITFEKLMPTTDELKQFTSARQLHSSNFYKAIGCYMDSMKS